MGNYFSQEALDPNVDQPLMFGGPQTFGPDSVLNQQQFDYFNQNVS